MVSSTASGATILLAMTEKSYQLLTKFPLWKRGIEGSIYSLVRSLFGWIIGAHPSQSASNLLWRPASHYQGHYHFPENGLWNQFLSTGRTLFSGAGSLIGRLHIIVGLVRRLLDLTADCGWRTTKNISYLPDTALTFQFGHYDRSFLNSEIVV